MKNSNLELHQKISHLRTILTPARRAHIAFMFRAKMVELQLKNVDIACRLGVSEANVSRWLRGDQNLSLDTLHALSDALEANLGVTVHRSEAAGWEQDNAESLVAPANVIELHQFRELRDKTTRKYKFAKPMSEIIGANDGDAYERAAALG